MRPPESSSSRDPDAADFECNICFELAEDLSLLFVVISSAGLNKWLHIHSHSQECPVCKALIEEEKLIPPYGRGKTQTDPRSEIPHRPAGQLPATAPPDNNNFPNFGFGGFICRVSARFGNFAMSAGFGGLFLSLLDMHNHRIQNPFQYGPRHAYGPRFLADFTGDIIMFLRFFIQGEDIKSITFSRLLFMIGFFVLLMMIL